MKKSIITLACLAATCMFAGCGTFNTAVRAYGAAAVTDLQAAEDTNLAALGVAICGTPYSAIIRHPEWISSIREKCLPSGGGSDPSALLVKPLTFPEVIEKAKQQNDLLKLFQQPKSP